jgi:hypothetical protein
LGSGQRLYSTIFEAGLGECVGTVGLLNRGRFPPKNRVIAMEKYIHRENLTLFKKRLAESHSDAERKVLLKLLAEEKAKEPPPKNDILKSR